MKARNIPISEEVIAELSTGTDGLDKRLKVTVEGIIRTDTSIEVEVKAIAVSHPTLVDLKRQKSVGDPYVIAVAKVNKGGVVTQESNRPNKIKIPHVCQHYGIVCTKLLDYMRHQSWRF